MEELTKSELLVRDVMETSGIMGMVLGLEWEGQKVEGGSQKYKDEANAAADRLRAYMEETLKAMVGD